MDELPYTYLNADTPAYGWTQPGFLPQKIDFVVRYDKIAIHLNKDGIAEQHEKPINQFFRKQEDRYVL